ncbi:Crp/Fnr family transcriptional regulator [Hymenobacter oligotrophus]|uniref:Crp/Fnr family transcriptional regulator n=1 Tax=Hymenobacter oligotrophus TaxID=2319843 RepID=A0A3B7RA58_9BACT|nr:Crp/Fnr family transcriptional regulator [Hymenobacter oligotrophus]AYA37941.1 Crp/Fnr family transcriptional regulator [Hymenobacter oligotrophus]
MEPLTDFLRRIYPVPDADLARILPLWQEVHFGRREFITRAGEVGRHLYFVLEGIQRSYHLRDGKEYTLAFTYPPSFTGIPESVLVRQPSPHFLECITPSRLLRLPYDKMEQLMLESPAAERLMRKLTEQILVGVLHRQTELLTCSMAERFRLFLQRSPHLLNAVPHKHLASYLGMDATNFSKLLNQLPV